MSKFAEIYGINDIEDLKISTLYKKLYSCLLDKSKFDVFLCFAYSLTIEKFFYYSFLFPWKFVESTCFLKQGNPIRDLSPPDYFSPSVIWPSLNTKIIVKANSKHKKYNFFFFFFFEFFCVMPVTGNTIVTRQFGDVR